MNPKRNRKRREEPHMDNRNVQVEERHVEHKSDSSMVAATFIKYAAYIIIFFGVLYFLIRYIIPMF